MARNLRGLVSFWNGIAFKETIINDCLACGEGFLTHSVPAGFYLDFCFLGEELAACCSLGEEGVENCYHGVSVYVPHGKGIVKQKWAEKVQAASRSMVSSIRVQQSYRIVGLSQVNTPTQETMLSKSSSKLEK
jgi:hypothetical protein